MINWWLEKGLAGFRIDAIINIKKDLDFPNLEPDGADGLAGCWRMVENVEGVGEYLEDLKKNTFEKYDAFTVAEVFNMHKDELSQFIGENGHFSTIFDYGPALHHQKYPGKSGTGQGSGSGLSNPSRSVCGFPRQERLQRFPVRSYPVLPAGRGPARSARRCSHIRRDDRRAPAHRCQSW